MMKKKLWDIPRLKIGASKKDSGLDSPPATPQSVAPPLSPGVDYELRTACALVLQDFKPSDYVYHERFGDADDDDANLDYKTQLNYAAFMQALEDGEDEEQSEVPLDPVNTRIPVAEPRTIDAVVNQASPGLAKAVASPTANSTFSDGLWRRVRGEQTEPEEQVQLPPRQWVPKARPRSRSIPHKRSVSHPAQPVISLWNDGHTERPRSAPRANSLKTEGSTPGTDSTDDGQPASTMPTTAAISPAHISKRTSSQAWRSASAAGLEANVVPVDGDWMRRELENHKQAQDEARAQQEIEDQIRASLGDPGSEEALNTANTTIDPVSPVLQEAQPMQVMRAAAPVVRMPARKPVPPSTADTSQNIATHQRADSRPSTEMRRSTSRKRRSTPRSESRAELEMLRPESRPGRESSDLPTMAPKASIDVQRPVYRNTGIRAPAPSGNVSQVPSRSTSITGKVRDFIRRPSTRTLSRKPSVENARPASRSRSMDSVRSAVSALSSNDYVPSKWKSFIPFHQNQDSTDGKAPSRSSSRGRASSGEAEQVSKRKEKPPINLNRELPPLPSLDKWKDEEEEPEPPVPQRPAHILDLPTSAAFVAPESAIQNPAQSRSQKPSIDSTASQQPRDSVLNVTSPPPHAHPKRTSSLKAPTNPSKYPIPDSAPEPVVSPLSSSTAQSKQLAHRAADPPATSSTTAPFKTRGARHIANYSTSAVARTNSTLGHRSTSYGPMASAPAPAKSMSMEQPRSVSEQPDFSRNGNVSSDDYHRGQARRELGSRRDTRDPKASALPPMPKKDEKPVKKRWWQSGRSSKRSMSWMDQVAGSGPKAGVSRA